LALIIAYVGLETGTSFHYIVGAILAVAAPDALELFLGNGLADRMSRSSEGDDDE
jgi:purine-cytosine permease-like protein